MAPTSSDRATHPGGHEIKDRAGSAAFARVEREAGLGLWTLSPATQQWTWSSGMRRLHATPADALPLPPGAEAITRTVLPGERSRVAQMLAVFDQCPEERPASVTLDYWVRADDGNLRRIWLHGRWRPTPSDPAGAWAGVAQDITEAHFAGRALAVRSAGAAALGQWESADTGCQGLVAAVGEALHASAGALWFTRTDNPEVVARWGAAAPAEDLAAQHGSLVDAARESGELVVRVDAIGVPLTAAGVTSGVLTLSVDSVNVVDEALAAALRWFGTAAGPRVAACRGRLTRSITRREREVLQLVADGEDVEGIAAALVLSPLTVKTHLKNAYMKLGASGRASAVALALRLGLIS